MKKLMIKTVLLAVFVLCYLFIDPVRIVLNYEINTVAITRFLAENLYKDEENVSSSPMEVKDYVVEGNRLYIFPLGQKIALPIDVMIVKVYADGMEVVNLDCRYKISHIKERTGNLYQYIHRLQEFASTDDFYLIEGEDLSAITGRLTIHYEKV